MKNTDGADEAIRNFLEKHTEILPAILS